MELIRNNRLVLIILGFIIGALVGIFVTPSEDEAEPDTQTSVTEESDDQQDEQPLDETETTDNEGEEETDFRKEVVPTQNVLEAPVIFTGFGNSPNSPLGLSQQTSTTCTTDPGAECTVTFTNVDTQEEVSFEPSVTDSTGVTRWEWVGSDVGSGTWNVVGTAGDKTSATGTIYIQ